MRLPQPPNLLPPFANASGGRPEEFSATRPPLARRLLARSLRIARAIIITAGVSFVVLAWTTRSSDTNALRAIRDSAAVRSIVSLIRGSSSGLIGERNDRVNILLLGIGGEGHDGPLLTDTMIIASIQPSTRRAALISIPRDLVISVNGTIEKANAINAFAESRERGSGGRATREALERVLGIAIPYHIRVDFSGFAGLVDDLGGVDIVVEHTLDDSRYPIEGNEDASWEERFEHLVIPAGRQHMDGALALKYVRSRHAIGVEGSDFARGRRQQRLLLAVRDRALTTATIINPRRVLALLDAWQKHVDTNLAPQELYQLSTIGLGVDSAALAHVVFTDAPDGELTAGIEHGVYVLRPRDGTFERIRGIIARVFETTTTATTVAAQPVSVEIWNGTTVAGLAAKTATTLERGGFTVRNVRNAPIRNVSQSIIYYRPTLPTETITRIRALIPAETSTAFPSFTDTTSDTTMAEPWPPDILIVLGASALAKK